MVKLFSELMSEAQAKNQTQGVFVAGTQQPTAADNTASLDAESARLQELDLQTIEEEKNNPDKFNNPDWVAAAVEIQAEAGIIPSGAKQKSVSVQSRDVKVNAQGQAEVTAAIEGVEKSQSLAQKSTQAQAVQKPPTGKDLLDRQVVEANERAARIAKASEEKRIEQGQRFMYGRRDTIAQVSDVIKKEIATNQLGDMGIDPETLGQTVIDQFELNNHSYLTYKAQDVKRYEEELSKGVKARPLSGMKQYLAHKQNFMSKVKSGVGTFVEADKAVQARQNAETNLARQAADLKRMQQDFEMKPKELRLAQDRHELNKQQLELQKAGARYRVFTSASEPLYEKEKDGGIRGTKAMEAVANGAGCTRAQAEIIAHTISPERRQVFIDTAVRNYESANRMILGEKKSSGDVSAGDVSVGTMTSKEESTVIKVAKKLDAEGYAPDEIVAKIKDSGSVNKDAGPAISDTVNSALSDKNDNAIRDAIKAQKEADATGAESMRSNLGRLVSDLDYVSDTDDGVARFITEGTGLSTADLLGMSSSEKDFKDYIYGRLSSMASDGVNTGMPSDVSGKINALTGLVYRKVRGWARAENSERTAIENDRSYDIMLAARKTRAGAGVGLGNISTYTDKTGKLYSFSNPFRDREYSAIVKSLFDETDGDSNKIDRLTKLLGGEITVGSDGQFSVIGPKKSMSGLQIKELKATLKNTTLKDPPEGWKSIIKDSATQELYKVNNWRNGSVGQRKAMEAVIAGENGVRNYLENTLNPSGEIGSKDDITFRQKWMAKDSGGKTPLNYLMEPISGESLEDNDKDMSKAVSVRLDKLKWKLKAGGSTIIDTLRKPENADLLRIANGGEPGAIAFAVLSAYDRATEAASDKMYLANSAARKEIVSGATPSATRLQTVGQALESIGYNKNIMVAINQIPELMDEDPDRFADTSGILFTSIADSVDSLESKLIEIKKQSGVLKTLGRSFVGRSEFMTSVAGKKLMATQELEMARTIKDISTLKRLSIQNFMMDKDFGLNTKSRLTRSRAASEYDVFIGRYKTGAGTKSEKVTSAKFRNLIKGS